MNLNQYKYNQSSADWNRAISKTLFMLIIPQAMDNVQPNSGAIK